MWFLQTPFLFCLLLTIVISLIALRKILVISIQKVYLIIRNAIYWNPVSIIYSILLISYAVVFPLSYDEAFTFNHYTSKSLMNVLATYQQPNNHVFHSLLTWISWKLLHWMPGPDIVRLPTLIASILSFQLISHHFLKRSTVYSLLLLVITIAISNYFQLSFQARGYSIQCFLALISFILIRQDAIAFNVRYFGFMLLCFIALFTVPTYLFTAVALGTFWLTKDVQPFYKNSLQVVLITLVFSIITFLAYTPIMLHEGVDALFSNQFVVPKSKVGILDVLLHANTISLFAFLPYPLAFLIPLAFIFYAVKTKQFPLLMLIVAPLILMYILNQSPKFLRIFLPITFLMSTITLHQLALTFPTKNIKKLHLALLSLFVLASVAFGLYHFEYTHEKLDFNSAFHLRTINRRTKQANKVEMIGVYWHLKEPIEAQNKMHPEKKIKKIKVVPTHLPPNTYLVSSAVLPQFTCTDTFKLHKGRAYLYCEK